MEKRKQDPFIWPSGVYFGGEDAFSHRQELDQRKKQLCRENNVRLIEWPYSTLPTEHNIQKALSNSPQVKKTDLEPEKDMAHSHLTV